MNYNAPLKLNTLTHLNSLKYSLAAHEKRLDEALGWSLTHTLPRNHHTHSLNHSHQWSGGTSLPLVFFPCKLMKMNHVT